MALCTRQLVKYMYVLQPFVLALSLFACQYTKTQNTQLVKTLRKNIEYSVVKTLRKNIEYPVVKTLRFLKVTYPC